VVLSRIGRHMWWWSAARASAMTAFADGSRRSSRRTVALVSVWRRRFRGRRRRGWHPSAGASRAAAGCVRSVQAVQEIFYEHARRRGRGPARGRATRTQGSRDRGTRGNKASDSVADARDRGLEGSCDRREGTRRVVSFSPRRSWRLCAQGSSANRLLQRHRFVCCPVDPQPHRRGADRGRSRR